MPVARTGKRLPPLQKVATPAASAAPPQQQGGTDLVSFKSPLPEELLQPSRHNVATHHSSADSPPPPPVFQRLAQNPASGGRFSRAANALRRAAKQLVLAERFESLNPEMKKFKKRNLAPFSLVTRYQRVRALLDPVRDRHLLGSDTLPVASKETAVVPNPPVETGGSTSRRGSEADGGEGTTEGSRRNSRLSAIGAGSGGGATAFEPDHEVPMETVMVPLGERLPSDKHVARRGVAGGSGLGFARWAASQSAAQASDDSAAERAALPDGQEIALLPQELALTFFTVATDRFRKLLYPRLLLVAQKRKLRALEHEMLPRASRPSTDLFKKFKLFATWPPEALSLAVESLVYRCVDANRFVWYTGEPGGTLGVVILSHGSCKSLRNSRRGLGEKRLTNENTLVLGTHHSGHMFNEYSFVTEEPQMRFVKTLTRCDLWCLSSEAFHACMVLLPEPVRQTMTQLAFQRRQKMIPEAYAFTPQLLRRQCSTFSRNHDPVLTSIIQAMKPIAMLAGQTIADEGEMPASMFFLRRGKAGAYQVVNGELTHVRSIYAPATLLESSLLHRQENTELLKTISDCDFLSITLDDIHNIMSQHPAEREILLEVSREEKMKILSKQQLRFRPLLFKIPILRHLLEAEHISALSHLFEGRVYAAMEIIASKATMCDRVVILTKGEVSMGVKGQIWNLGEAIGFACLIPHRWTHSIVALSQCECIELRRDYLEAFLQDCEVYDDALEVCELLMCPARFKRMEEERRMVDGGLALTPALRELHRRGELLSPQLQRRWGSSPSPNTPSQVNADNGNRLYSLPDSGREAQRRRERLSGIINSILHDLEVMLTPATFPKASDTRFSVKEAQSEPGFVSCNTQCKLTELAVPGGLFVPSMTEAEREEALAAALFNHKRDPVRRVAKITPFLMVKQRS